MPTTSSEAQDFSCFFASAADIITDYVARSYLFKALRQYLGLLQSGHKSSLFRQQDFRTECRSAAAKEGRTSAATALIGFAGIYTD